jgi:molybdopterin-guanine dinucleotide biosynthesis protein B
MKVLAVLGTKNSGKTSVAEFIINRLSREGYKVGAVKHIHHSFTIDTQGKDTWRFSRAGARLVVSVSPNELATIKRLDSPLTDLDEILEAGRREGLDIMILEGFRGMMADRRDIPVILTAKDAEELESLTKGLAAQVIAVSGVIAAGSQRPAFSAPILDFRRRGRSLIRLVKEALSLTREGVGLR